MSPSREPAPSGYGNIRPNAAHFHNTCYYAIVKDDSNNNKYNTRDVSPNDTLSTAHSNNAAVLNSDDERSILRPTYEYVLNVAFVSFISFTLLQGVCAIIANSDSLLADSEAMSVDAMTYLFNMWAERVKNRPPNEEELNWPLSVREHRMERKRLTMELYPPLISVMVLIAVTISTLGKAIGTILGEQDLTKSESDDVNAGLMLLFSGLNLVLDVVNVTCFARAQGGGVPPQLLQDTASGRGSSWMVNHKLQYNSPTDSHPSEQAYLLSDNYVYDEENEIRRRSANMATTGAGCTGQDNMYESVFDSGDVNLNMCSACTHIGADTLRSTAVLSAACVSYLFDTVTPATADSAAAIAVSVTILISLIPLIQGLYSTARQLVIERKNQPVFSLDS